MKGILVIVSCGQRKVWDLHPSQGPTRAADSYVGTPFLVNRLYARAFAERWGILSAKYGFIPPDFLVPASYNVTFKKKSTNPVSFSILKKQVMEQDLASFPTIIGLRGIEYRAVIEQAFDGLGAHLNFPFAGLIVGKAMHAIKVAIERGNPLATELDGS